MDCAKLEGARVWLTTKALGEIVEDAVPSVKGDQPAKYYSGIKDKKEKESRAKHFAKGADKPDDDPKSYTPAPGDKDAKTKPSKQTCKHTHVNITPFVHMCIILFKTNKWK